MSSDEADSEQSGQYWQALEILAEDRRRYKIRWAGTDPDTGEPWENSWTLKEYVTSDLVQTWKRKKQQATKEKKETRASSSRKAVATRKSRAPKSKSSRDSSESVRELDGEELSKRPVKKQVQRKPLGKGREKQRVSLAEVTEVDEGGHSRNERSLSWSPGRSLKSGGSKQKQVNIEPEEPPVKIGPPSIKLGPPRGKKRKVPDASESSPRKKRRLPYPETDGETYSPIIPTPRRNVSESSRLSPSVDDISATAVSARTSSVLSPPKKHRPRRQPHSSSRSPSSLASLPSPEQDRQPLEHQPDDSPKKRQKHRKILSSSCSPSSLVSPEQSKRLREGQPNDPPSPPRVPSWEDDIEEEEDEDEVQNSLLDEMEESYLNLDPEHEDSPSSPTSPTSPIRVLLRESQQEIIEETIYPVGDTSLPVTSTTQEVHVGTQSQLLLTTQSSGSPSQSRHQHDYNQLSTDHAKLQAQHTVLEQEYNILEDTLSLSNSRVSQLEKVVEKLRSQHHTKLREIFDTKIKSLEEELENMKQINCVLQEKDRLTNDEIRRRAACEPELRARNEELERTVKANEEISDALELAVKESEEKVDRLQASVKENEDKIKELEDVVKKSGERIRELEAAAEESEGRKQRLEETLETSEGKLKELQEVVANSEERIRELNEAGEVSQQKMKKLEEAVTKSEETIRKLDESNNKYEDEILRLVEADMESQDEIRKLQAAANKLERLRDELLSKEQERVDVSIDAVEDEDIEPEQSYAVCEFAGNGKKCLRRFHTGEAVIQHTFKDHYNLSFEDIFA